MHTWTEASVTEIRRQLRYMRNPSNLDDRLIGKTAGGRLTAWASTRDMMRGMHG
jgi:hypothetical protein